MQQIARQFKEELEVYRLVLHHPGTPRLAKWLLGMAVAYLLMPFDLIPDFIPVLGQLDDLVIIPAIFYLAIRMIPPGVVTECRQAVLAANMKK